MQRFGEGLAASQGGDRDLARTVAASQGGDRDLARTTFNALWAEVGEGGDPLHRCAIAHAMTDVQDDLHDELAWDLRALDAAEGLTDERVQSAGVQGSARSFQPSLHLNLADVYRRLGRSEEARRHVETGLATVDALGDDGYVAMTRDGLARIERQLDEVTPPGTGSPGPG